MFLKHIKISKKPYVTLFVVHVKLWLYVSKKKKKGKQYKNIYRSVFCYWCFLDERKKPQWVIIMTILKAKKNETIRRAITKVKSL